MQGCCVHYYTRQYDLQSPAGIPLSPSQIGAWAKKTGLNHNRRLLRHQNEGAPGQAPFAPSLRYKVASKVVFSKVKAQLGLDKCLRSYSAAAPLSKEMLEYFMSLDIRYA